MRAEEVRVGARVRVCPSYRKPRLRGAVGTVVKLWGVSHQAVEVRFDSGRSELFWRHQLDEIRQDNKDDTFAWLRWG